MACHKCHSRRILTMRECDSRVGACAECSGHSWNDLEADSGIGQGRGLFTSSSEGEWIAPLQSYHSFSLAGRGDDARVDFRLMETATFP